jgi:hypothetical protein
MLVLSMKLREPYQEILQPSLKEDQLDSLLRRIWIRKKNAMFK